MQKNDYQNAFMPTLITNNNLTLGDCLNDELTTANSFIFAVAFITEGGLLMLKTKLADLAKKNIRGTIITSTYLNFNQPKMFNELLKLSNVTVLIVEEINFHTKAYYIEHENKHTVIVGSSNLTATALKTNVEWNLKLSSLDNDQFTNHFIDELKKLAKNAIYLTKEWIVEYAKNYQPLVNDTKKVDNTLEIKPNEMQIMALNALDNLRKTNAQKGLIVSATGTGKTYLAAFDVKKNNVKKMLFVAHREQLLKQAKFSFEKIFKNTKTMGIFSGHKKDIHADYVFATIQTLSKHYFEFKMDEFDYIVIDETHRARANSYQLIFDYFKPKFLLGLTATPQRMDGFNVYELFDYNLVYEISLNDALKADMLVPFNYIGVTDYTIDNKVIEDLSDLKYLVADERVKHLINKTNYYGYSGKELHGLIFVSRVDEGEVLANKLTGLGIDSEFLSAKSSEIVRTTAIQKLKTGKLKYLIAVDIFNEGIDIPEINQIVMMRSTQSKIVFLQQLGRGLRKNLNKEYLTVIDFIGNYQNNYLIAQSFEQKNKNDKDYLRMQIVNPQISGLSTINFEEIAQQRILSAINNVKFDKIATLRASFGEIIDRFGKTPTLVEVYKTKLFDLQLVFNKFKSYPEFVAKMLNKKEMLFKQDFLNWLTFVTQDLMLSKRRHELLILNVLLDQKEVSTLEIIAILKDDFQNNNTIESIIRVLEIKDYFTAIDRRKYGNIPLIKITDDVWEFSREFSDEEKSILKDTIKTGILKISDELNNDQWLTLYQKYKRKDVVRVLNWANDLPGIDIGGYKYDERTNTLPIFITLEKNEKITTNMEYTNNFLSQNRISFYSKANRTLNSPIENTLFNAKEKKVFVPLFVKKSDDEGVSFYYLGEVSIDKTTTRETTLMNKKTNKQQPVVYFELVLNSDVKINLWQYLVQ